MGRYLNTALRMVLITLVIYGILYPFAMTGLSQVLFPKQANGSLIVEKGAVIGSELIGQSFTRPEYFHPRPSVAGNGYDPTQSGGSNLGPTSKALHDRVTTAVAKLIQENPGLKSGEVPIDMVTTSASGLDPDITPANAYAQAARVATARGVTTDVIRQLIDKETTHRQFGFLGEPRVNVLAINRALDAQYPIRAVPSAPSR